MNGTGNCKTCGKQFKWYRAKQQKPKIYCSKECFEKQPKPWIKERFKKLMGDENHQKEIAKNRFEGLVLKKEGCWEWKGCQHHSGYLPFRYIGRKNDFAHRASWRIYHGEIPDEMLVLHKCDNKRCTNPDHLFLGTHKDNTADMHEKKRGQYGEKHHKCKLNVEKVKEIKKLLKMGVKSTRIALDYGVSNGTIWFISHNITWKHI